MRRKQPKIYSTPDVFIAIALFFFCHQSLANETLYTAHYKGEYSGWNIELQRQLIKTSDGYIFSSKFKNFFASMEEISRFRVAERAIQAEEYKYQRKVFGKSTIERIVFDWGKLEAHYTRSDRKKNNRTHKLTAGYLDPSLYQLKLQADTANKSQSLSYTFLKRKRIKHYTFSKSGTKPFKFLNKTFSADILVHEDEEKSKRTEVWLLPTLDNQIAKVVHQDKDGDTYSIELDRYYASPGEVDQFYRAFVPNEPQAPTTTTH